MPRRGPYGLPKRRAYMIYDLPHARSAVSRAEQNATPSEKKKIARAIYGRFKTARRWPWVRKQLGMKPLKR